MDKKNSGNRRPNQKINRKVFGVESIPRRRLLQGTVAIASLVPGLTTVGARKDVPKKNIDEADPPYAQTGSVTGDPTSPVYHTSPLEYKNLKDNIFRFNDEKDPHLIYSPHLVRKLEGNGKGDNIDIQVRTIGKRTSLTSKGPFKRKIHGWQCRAEEIERLEDYGKITYKPRFASTKATIRGVSVEDLDEIAVLPFVLEINDAGSELEPANLHKDVVRGTDVNWFSSIEDDLYANQHVGVLDWGYDKTRYTEHYTDTWGVLDESLSEKFEEDWDDSDSHDEHGANMTDSITYMIGEDPWQHTNITHLRIDAQLTTQDRAKQAIEFAEEWGLSTINMSFGSDLDDVCHSYYCDVLLAYTQAGYIPCAATHNDASTSQVRYPAQSRLTIGVGAVTGECSGSGSYQRWESSTSPSGSNMGTISFVDGSWGPVYCYDCAYSSNIDEKFSPNVYGYSRILTDANQSIGATSGATTQASAAATVMQSQVLFDYEGAKDIFENMNYYDVCAYDNETPAPLGQVNDAWDAYHSV